MAKLAFVFAAAVVLQCATAETESIDKVKDIIKQHSPQFVTDAIETVGRVADALPGASQVDSLINQGVQIFKNATQSFSAAGDLFASVKDKFPGIAQECGQAAFSAVVSTLNEQSQKPENIPIVDKATGLVGNVQALYEDWRSLAKEVQDVADNIVSKVTPSNAD